MKKQKIDMERVILWGLISILAILVIYVVFFNNSADSNTLTAGKITSEVAYSGMVGGC